MHEHNHEHRVDDVLTAHHRGHRLDPHRLPMTDAAGNTEEPLPTTDPAEQE